MIDYEGDGEEMNIDRVRAFFRKYQYPILFTVKLRIIISLWMMFIGMIIDRYYPDDSLLLKSAFGQLTPQPTLIGRALLDVWLRWDAVHYMNIALQGYSGVGTGDYNFPPLYPYLTLAFKWLTFSNEIIAGLLISTLATMIAFVLLYKFIREDYDDERLARNTVLVYGLYPTSFFLFAPYTDGLFLCLTVAFFLLLYKRRWILAGILISLASITRIQGVLLVLPFIFEFVRDIYGAHEKVNWRIISGFSLAPLGFILFSIWRANQKTPPLIDTFNQYSQIVFVNPIHGMILAIRQFMESGSLLVLGELLSLLLFGIIVAWMISQKRYRGNLSMLVYSASLIILFLSKHSYTASAMQSSTRYVLAVFPAFIGIGQWMGQLSSRGQKIVRLTSFLLLLLVSTLYGFWFFVG